MPEDTEPLPEETTTEITSVIEGDGTNNTLPGTPADDLMLGLGGDDTLVGGRGSDTLEGGDGNDTLTGDGGDTEPTYAGFNDFAFDRTDGTDTITDFKTDCPACRLLPDTPVDEIILIGGSPEDIDAVVAGVTTNPGGDAVLHYGETNIVLTGQTPADVQDFWFALG
jgi:hypothetical protein